MPTLFPKRFEAISHKNWYIPFTAWLKEFKARCHKEWKGDGSGTTSPSSSTSLSPLGIGAWDMKNWFPGVSSISVQGWAHCLHFTAEQPEKLSDDCETLKSQSGADMAWVQCPDSLYFLYFFPRASMDRRKTGPWSSVHWWLPTLIFKTKLLFSLWRKPI